MVKILANYIAARGDTSVPVIAVGDFDDGYAADGAMNTALEDFIDRSGLRSTYAATHTMGSANKYITARRSATPPQWDASNNVLH